MTVSKRTRFEVMRRDGFRCQYCGLKGTETGAGLTIDHVVPVALGGSDSPNNLVAACRDCNAGKTSAMPDEEMVPDAVPSEIQRLAIEQRRAKLQSGFDDLKTVASYFYNHWGRWTVEATGRPVAMPTSWREVIYNLYRTGAPIDLLLHSIDIAMERANPRYGEFAEFNYAVGIVRNKMTEAGLDYSVTPDTARTYTQREYDDYGEKCYEDGLTAGADLADRGHRSRDFLAMLIDGRTDNPVWEAASAA